MKPVFIKKLQRNVEIYEDDDLQVKCKTSKNLPPVFVEELPFRVNFFFIKILFNNLKIYKKLNTSFS